MNLAAEPLVPELPHLVDHGLEPGALAGQLVLDAGRRLGVAPADDDPLRLEPPEPLRERAWADPGAGVLELSRAALRLLLRRRLALVRPTIRSTSR